MIKNNNKSLWFGAFFVFLLDQLTKILSLHFLGLEEEFRLNHYFSLQRIYNEATVMLNYPLPFGLTVDGFRIAWVTIAIVLTLGIFWVNKQQSLNNSCWEAEFSKVGLFLILGGIWGNAFDRIFRKEGVIDFIRLNFFKEAIPIMNIADIMIYMGEFCLITAWAIVLFKLFHKKSKHINI